MVAKVRIAQSDREQVLFGMGECFAEHFSKPVELTPETDFLKFVVEGGYDNDILFNGIIPLEIYFGFRVTNDGWLRLLLSEYSETSRRVTMADVADFILEQLSISISFAPAVVFGQRCLPAGVFLGMQSLASHVQPDVEKFGPSTKIRDRLSGFALQRYCHLLHWLTSGAAPAPTDPLDTRSFWRQMADFATLFISIALFITMLLLQIWLIPRDCDWVGWMIAGSTLIYFTFVAVIFHGLHEVVWRYSNPLPKGVVTFRDLARLIALRFEEPEAESLARWGASS